MTAQLLLLLLAACASLSCATTPLPTRLGITGLDVGFLSDRRSSDRKAGERPQGDLLFLEVRVGNPDPSPRQVAVLCTTADRPAPVRQVFTVAPRSVGRQRILGFAASPVAYRVRCRLEAASAPADGWVEVEVPANDHTLSAPI